MLFSMNIFIIICLAVLQSLQGRILKVPFGTSLTSEVGCESTKSKVSKSSNTVQSLRGGFSSDNLFDIASAEEFETILADASASGKLVVMDFYAEWCMPCKIIAPVYAEMSAAEEFSNAVFVKVDIDKVQSIAEKYEITSMPTFLFIKDGAVVSRFSGASVEKLAETIKSLI
jgi:thioredoxin 1